MRRCARGSRPAGRDVLKALDTRPGGDVSEGGSPRNGSLPYEDYRSSHQGKGEDYHARFSGSSHRALMWRIEQDILRDLMRAYFSTSSLERPLSRSKGVRHLDFACGTGRVLKLLEDEVDVSTGVDVAPSMLEIARREAERAEFHCVDITRDDVLGERQFDLITAFRFFPNAEPALRDEAMARLALSLAPGGILVFNNHLRAGSLRHRAIQAKVLRGELTNKRRRHVMSDEEVSALAARHDLAVVESRHLGLLPVQKERRPLPFARVILSLERLATRMRFLAPLAALKVYVLRARSDLPNDLRRDLRRDLSRGLQC